MYMNESHIYHGVWSLIAALVILIVADGSFAAERESAMIDLPQPRFEGLVSVEKALRERRSVREYSNRTLTLQECAQILWAAQGVTDSRGYRTAPSGGALYPLELYLVVGRVDGLAPGVYRYIPGTHTLQMKKEGDIRDDLSDAALGQPQVRKAPAVLVFSVVYERITRKYGERGKRYALIEAGHAAQNVYLQAESLGLGTVSVGAFSDDDVHAVTGMSGDEEAIYILPVGGLEELR